VCARINGCQIAAHISTGFWAEHCMLQMLNLASSEKENVWMKMALNFVAFRFCLFQYL